MKKNVKKNKKDGFGFLMSITVPDNGSVIEDIKSGALPLREIPGFIVFMVGRSFWPLMGVIIVGLLVAFSVR